MAPKNRKSFFNALDREVPNPKVELRFRSPLELLIATLLSAQCTDQRVNRVTEKLFQKYKSVEDYASADLRRLEEEIKSTGFYRSKAKNIIGSSKKIVTSFNGKVPGTMEELLTLPGVWRKTANVVLGNCFGVPSIVVDTHVKRVCQRLGLTSSNDPDLIEKDLSQWIPRNQWTRVSHQLLLHGRYTCKAKSPLCDACGLKRFCQWFQTLPRPKSLNR